MTALITPNQGDTIQASHIFQLTGLIAGVAGKGQSVNFTQQTDAADYANKFGNVDTTNGYAAQFQYGPAASPTKIMTAAKNRVTVYGSDAHGFFKVGEAARKYVSFNFTNETPIAGSENVLIAATRSDTAVMVDVGLTNTGASVDSAAMRISVAQTTVAASTLLQALEVHSDRTAVAVNGTTWGMGVTLSDETGGTSGASGYNESVGLRISSADHGGTTAAVRAQSAIWITGGNNTNDTEGGWRNALYYEENATKKAAISKAGLMNIGDIIPLADSTHLLGSVSFNWLAVVTDYITISATPPAGAGNITDNTGTVGFGFRDGSVAQTCFILNNAVRTVLFDANNNVAIGKTAPATNATSGFPYIPAMAGTPSGTPTAITGYAPVVYDTSANKIWAYNGSWRGVAVT